MKNKIKYNWIWLIVISIVSLEAKPIAVNVAKDNALRWMKSRNHQNYSIKKDLFASNSTKSRSKKNPSKYKILELEPKGWVIVSLDDVIKPIIGYGDSSIDSNLPPAMIEYLDNIEKTIEYKNKHPKAVRKKNDQKMLYGANDYGYVVRPLLWMGSTSDTEEQGIRWDQGRYYNAYTPVDANGNHTWTGCVATAMGQLMRYWKYPSVGLGENTYTPYSHPEYGEQHADFANTTYDWANMPLRLTSDNHAVAQALYHAGVAVDMDYDPEESGAILGGGLKESFNYKLSVHISRTSFTKNEWYATLKKELDEARPVMYSGRVPNGPGHQFIIDGYDTDGYYHFNWGWGGSYNGKFTLENIIFSYNQDAYIIAPIDPSPQVSIADSNFASCIVDQLSLEDSSEIKELSLKYTGNLFCMKNNISSVKELSYFKYLTALSLADNNLHGTLDLSNKQALYFVEVDNNNISTLLLPNKERGYGYVSLEYNPKLNILDIANLKNIDRLYAYGTESVTCWQVNALKAENNITNIYIGCTNTASDSLDSDGDGISNLDDPDDDNDGINDLKDDDIDGDGINNIDERKWGFDPLDPSDGGSADADGDGVSNVDEIKAGSNPLDPNDTKKPKRFVPIMMDDMVIMVPLKH